MPALNTEYPGIQVFYASVDNGQVHQSDVTVDAVDLLMKTYGGNSVNRKLTLAFADWQRFVFERNTAQCQCTRCLVGW